MRNLQFTSEDQQNWRTAGNILLKQEVHEAIRYYQFHPVLQSTNLQAFPFAMPFV